MAKFRHDISWKEGTVGNVLISNRDSLMESKACREVYDKVKKLFDDNHVTTPKSRLVLYKLENFSTLASSLAYVQNLIFASKGLATY